MTQQHETLIQLNLQFFAKDGPGGEKTEQPTAKKLSDARKKGQVAKSKEIASALGLFSFFIILKLYVGSVGSSFIMGFHAVYNQIPDVIKNYNGDIPAAAIGTLVRGMMQQLGLIVVPFLLAGFVVAFLSDLVQVKWRPTTQPLRPKPNKLSPMNGLKRLFSVNSLVELLKSVIKLVVIGYVVYYYLKYRIGELFLLYDFALSLDIGLIGETVIDMGIRIAAVYMVVAYADYRYQKWKFRDDMKMTKQEVKDEYKNMEGDPQVKGKQKQRMREASMRRMMQQLPEADVVITNPTHYAVAIKYDPDKYDAPYVIAKGEDFLAQKIKDVAKENHIEIVENKPLARMLYANVEIGGLVPPELYQAVAEVLAFVYHLKGKVS